MPRTVRQEYTFTGLEFAPNYLKPSWLIRAGPRLGTTDWFHEYLVPINTLVDHNTYLAFRSISLELHRDLTFFEAERVTFCTTVELREGDYQCISRVRVLVDQTRVAEIDYRFQALWVAQDAEMGGMPSRLPESIAECFEDDERGGERVVPPATSLADWVREQGDRLGENSRVFQIFPHHCEHADQWIYSTAAELMDESRSSLAARHEDSRIRATLGRAAGRVELRYDRPYFLFDEGRLETRVFALDDRLAFLHAFTQDHGPVGREDHALAVELYDLNDEAETS